MFTTFRGFARSTGGNVMVMTGFMFAMVMMAAGGAVDVTAAYNYRAELQSIADRAALYGAREIDRTEGEVTAFLDEELSEYEENTASPTVTKTGPEVTVKIDGEAANSFLGMFGINLFDVTVEAKAANVTGLAEDIEVALVLDVTESMADDMPALRSAALALVDSLYEAGEDRVKVSVVPYTSTVNVGNDAPMAWMDANAQNSHHAIEIERVLVKSCPAPPAPPSAASSSSTAPAACSMLCGCPGQMACGGGSDGAALDLMERLRYASAPVVDGLTALMTSGTAFAASHSYPIPEADECPFWTPDNINNFELFEAIPNSEWMGCVEARPAPYDVTDEQPAGSTPNTQFVPFFWVDDSDQYSATEHWLNNYLDDDIGLDEVPGVAEVPYWHVTQRASIYKYDGMTMADIVETGPDMRGPNRSCPAPILPLTSERDVVEQKIGNLTHRNGGGTIISEGLAWGWRAISPGEPFSEGVAYDDEEVKKIIILLSDGANAVQKRGDTGTGQPVDRDTFGDYTAYGHALSFNVGERARGFIDRNANPGTAYFDQVRGYLDERTRAVCGNIKTVDEETPVEIFTVLVGDHDTRTQALLSECATSEVTHYRNASQMAELTGAFASVAAEIIGGGRARLVH